MGGSVSTARMQRLTEMGFTVAESRAALEATAGDVDRAAELLTERRRAREAAEGGRLAFRINAFLQHQRPWDEFFGKFLWPEHLQERLDTNLFYYRANYFLICGGVAGVSLLMQPALLVLAGVCVGLHAAAAEWEAPVPLLNAPLTLEQRLVAATFASSLLMHWSGHAYYLLRVLLLCGGLTLGHATFRARNLSARWSWFRDQVEKLD